MENTIIYEKIDALEAKAKLIDDKLSGLILSVNSVKSVVTDTNTIVTDIYQGVQINEWIADLKASGLQSTTYNTPDRMNYLIYYQSAVLNADVNRYLMKYVSDNGKNIGKFIGLIISSETTTTVSWESLTTLNDIFSNVQAFTELTNSSAAFDLILKGAKPKTALYSNVAIVKPILNANAAAKNTLLANCSQIYVTGNSYDAYTFVGTITNATHGSIVNLYVRNENNQAILSKQLAKGASASVNNFVSDISKSGEGSDNGCNITLYLDLEVS